MMNTMMRRTVQSSRNSFIYPLDEFYARSATPLPPWEIVDGELVPEPYKKLLVHQDDMTPTLEEFYGQRARLQLVGRKRQRNAYFREVVLQLEQSHRPVEFGAIKINLDLFAPELRKEILQEQWPLGHLLKEHAIFHLSRPSAFLRLASDPLINRLLGLTGAHVLYGRRNTLFNNEGGALAEIVEILPPADGKGEAG